MSVHWLVAGVIEVSVHWLVAEVIEVSVRWLVAGVIEVSLHTDSDGYITLVAQPSTLRRNSLTASLPSFCEQLVVEDKVVEIQEQTAVSEAAMNKLSHNQHRLTSILSINCTSLSLCLMSLLLVMESVNLNLFSGG